jgi:hypothetical protein
VQNYSIRMIRNSVIPRTRTCASDQLQRYPAGLPLPIAHSYLLLPDSWFLTCLLRRLLICDIGSTKFRCQYSHVAYKADASTSFWMCQLQHRVEYSKLSLSLQLRGRSKHVTCDRCFERLDCLYNLYSSCCVPSACHFADLFLDALSEMCNLP